jgi:hypothetical protein
VFDRAAGYEHQERHMNYPEAKPRIRNYLAVLWRGRIVQSG